MAEKVFKNIDEGIDELGEHQEKTNFILYVNTIATIVTGIASLLIGLIMLWLALRG